MPNRRTGNDGLAIKLRQANQGYHLLDAPFKIVWSTRNPKQFHFTDRPIIWANNRLGGISSDNKEELLYLLALLNSSINRFVMEQFLKLHGEKDLLVQINFVKEFIRIPNFVGNEKVKQLKADVVNQIEQLLQLEQTRLADLVDFSNVLMQKFNGASVIGNFLELSSNNAVTRCPIKRNKEIVSRFFEQQPSQPTTLNELKNQLIIDETAQNELKKQIDDLVFCLYFNCEPSELENNAAYQYLIKQKIN